MRSDPPVDLVVAPQLADVVPVGVGLGSRLWVCPQLHFWGAVPISLVGMGAPGHLFFLSGEVVFTFQLLRDGWLLLSFHSSFFSKLNLILMWKRYQHSPSEERRTALSHLLQGR